MNLSDIATLQPDGWWQIDRDATLTGHLILTTERVRVIGSACLLVRGSARLTVRDSASLEVWGSACLDVRGSARLDVWDSASLAVRGSARLAVRGSARFAAPGWAEIASSGWALLRSPDGLYFAGCRMGLTHAQAVAHWGLPRTDERALAYSAALATELT